ncbi:MAG: hypothetical protein OXC72_05555 [Roseovarius sp.]|nr:hypothetical protein [Roseovarius sp.]
MSYKGLQKSFSQTFCLVLQEFLHLRGKKSLNIGFFMEEGMVCEKQKLAGITMGASNRIYLT